MVMLSMKNLERANMGLKAREIIEENFDEEIVINKFFDVLKDF